MKVRPVTMPQHSFHSHADLLVEPDHSGEVMWSNRLYKVAAVLVEGHREKRPEVAAPHRVCRRHTDFTCPVIRDVVVINADADQLAGGFNTYGLVRPEIPGMWNQGNRKFRQWSIVDKTRGHRPPSS